jgi:DNA-directed RNA polymerase specialized sigma24 family protein
VDTRSQNPWTDAGQDPELLRRAQRDDLTALLQIVDTHRLPLWRACLAITQHLGEAERLFQETIARATRELSQAPAQKPLLPWLAGLARTLDADRSRTRAPGASSPGGACRPNGRPWDDVSPDDADTYVEQHALHGFSLLDADDQWLLALRLFERLSYDDIAQVTGLPVERVAERLAIAREQIDEACDAEERAA